MKLKGKRVAILGAGIAGLAAAEQLAPSGVEVTMIERSPAPGGHAALLSCKAADECVRCGACIVQGKLAKVAGHSSIRIINGARIARIAHKGGFDIAYESPDGSGALHSDALLLTTGFKAYDPSQKPYGYGKFADVVTHLEVEALLKRHGVLKRPSDGAEPGHIAFIQCVGSRDSRIRHPWCSKICCGSALRMARLIQHRQPAVQATFFYIDVQTFGKNFQEYYDRARTTIHMVRAIPGDIFETAGRQLLVTYFEPQSRKAGEAIFDVVILSVGLTPAVENTELARMLGWPLTPWGFFHSHRDKEASGVRGIFTAGAALGPMSIAESMDSACQTGWDIHQYLQTL